MIRRASKEFSNTERTQIIQLRLKAYSKGYFFIKLTWANICSRAIWRIYILFPLIFGPVIIWQLKSTDENCKHKYIIVVYEI